MNQEVALRKRQHIAKANRTMFVWVAIASVIVGVAAVLSIFLVQRFLFNEKVLSSKRETLSTLKSNVGIADEFVKNVNNLGLIDESLQSMNPDGTQDERLRIILDALPSQANSRALSSSFQQKLLSSVTISSLVIPPVEEESIDLGTIAPNSKGAEYTIPFTFQVVANGEDNLQNVLVNLERSIRPIQVVSINIRRQSDTFVMDVTGYSYYQPSTSAAISQRVVK